MNRIHLIPSLIIFFTIVFLAVSCTNSDPVDPSITVVQNNVQTGQWRITSFIDSGKDETSHFSGFTFTFANNGVLTSTNGSITYTGSWSVYDSNSNDDNPDDLDFNILFNLTNDFEDLIEDWNFISHSSTKIELIDISGGNGGTDYLTFEKL